MNITVIGDLHFGVKENYTKYVDYQIETYREIIKEIKSKNIKQVVFLGDIFDNRKMISIPILDIILKELVDSELQYTFIVGNHDVYYKNTNKLNSLRVIFDKYDIESKLSFNKQIIEIIDQEPKELTIDGTLCLFVPWMTSDNYYQCVDAINSSTAKYCFGHFDIDGALMTKGIICKSELKPKIFKKFKNVFSGHFHLKSTIGNIIYVGSAFQLNWNDYNDCKRWIHIKDDSVQQITIDKYMFVKLIINDEFDFLRDINLSLYQDKFLKVILNRKLTNKEEKILISILENSIKHEIIDNTIIMDEEVDIIEDTDFGEIVKECISTYQGISNEIKEGAEKLIIKKYESIQRGE